MWITLVTRFREPYHSLSIVLANAISLLIEISKIGFGFDIVLRGTLLEPVNCLSGISGYSGAIIITSAYFILGLTISVFSKFPDFG